MDSRSFNTRLSTHTGLSAKDTAALSDALTTALRDCLTALDSVAIPGFGTFSAVKTDEHVETDAERGTAMLMPPSLAPIFTPGASLRKSVTPKSPKA